jgi:two-component system, response regulator YesN
MYRVLLVEDENYLLKELQETVPWERHGFTVVGCAATEEEGVRLFGTLHPHLIVTDIRLPGGSGLELLRRTGPAAAIVITGYDDFEYARRALRLGVADFLLKPIDDTELESALTRVQLELAGRRPLAWDQQAGPDADGKAAELSGSRTDGRERHVLAAEDFIRRRYREEISLFGAAEELGLSESYLSRLIRELRGETFVELLTHYRLNAARSLLRDQRLRIHEIAELCGFQDQSYFARIFKRVYKVSPSNFRSQITLPAEETETPPA